MQQASIVQGFSNSKIYAKGINVTPEDKICPGKRFFPFNFNCFPIDFNFDSMLPPFFVLL